MLVFTTLLTLRRGFTLEVTPVPIPNTAVKLQRADDTSWHTGGKVGRRDVNIPSPRSRGGFFIPAEKRVLVRAAGPFLV